jgi:hypothetical protein
LSKTIEERSRLVLLAYEVLNTIEVAVEGATDNELLTVMADAFRRRAADALEDELSKPKRRGKPKLPE